MWGCLRHTHAFPRVPAAWDHGLRGLRWFRSLWVDVGGYLRHIHAFPRMMIMIYWVCVSFRPSKDSIKKMTRCGGAPRETGASGAPRAGVWGESGSQARGQGNSRNSHLVQQGSQPGRQRHDAIYSLLAAVKQQKQELLRVTGPLLSLVLRSSCATGTFWWWCLLFVLTETKITYRDVAPFLLVS